MTEQEVDIVDMFYRIRDNNLEIRLVDSLIGRQDHDDSRQDNMPVR